MCSDRITSKQGLCQQCMFEWNFNILTQHFNTDWLLKPSVFSQSNKKSGHLSQSLKMALVDILNVTLKLFMSRIGHVLCTLSDLVNQNLQIFQTKIFLEFEFFFIFNLNKQNMSLKKFAITDQEYFQTRTFLEFNIFLDYYISSICHFYNCKFLEIPY